MGIEMDEGGWLGIFGARRREVGYSILRSSATDRWIIVDVYGFYGEKGRSVRIGDDCSFGLNSLLASTGKGGVPVVAEMLGAAMELSSHEHRWLLEALLGTYRDGAGVRLAEVVQWLEEARVVAEGGEARWVASLIAKLQLLVGGAGLRVFEGGCGLTDLNPEGGVVVDLSRIPTLYSRTVAQALTLLLLPLIPEAGGSTVYVDSIHLSLPDVWRLSRGDLTLRSWSSTMLLERLDLTRSMDVSMIFLSPTPSLVDRRLLSMADELLLLPPATPLALRSLGVSPKGGGRGYVVAGPSVQTLRTVDYGTTLLAQPRLAVGGHGGPAQPRRTLISALFGRRGGVVSEFLQALRLSMITRSEAIGWFRWRGVSGEEAAKLIDKMAAFQLVREVLVSGRKLLTLTLRGMRALEEARLWGVMDGED